MGERKAMTPEIKRLLTEAGYTLFELYSTRYDVTVRYTPQHVPDEQRQEALDAYAAVLRPHYEVKMHHAALVVTPKEAQ